ncbi:MAG: hypothetical protein WBZ51_19790, partial [Xanthobacteraceae bacterium]
MPSYTMPSSVAANATTPGTSAARVAARSIESMWDNVPKAGPLGALARAMGAWTAPNELSAASFNVDFTTSRRLGRWIMRANTCCVCAQLAAASAGVACPEI